MNPHDLDVDHSPPLYSFSSVVSPRTAAHYLHEAEYHHGVNSREAEYQRAFLRACESVPQTFLVGSLDAEYEQRKRGQS